MNIDEMDFEEVFASGDLHENLMLLGLPPTDDHAALLTWRRQYQAVLVGGMSDLMHLPPESRFALIAAMSRRFLVAVDDDLHARAGEMERELGLSDGAALPIEQRIGRLERARRKR